MLELVLTLLIIDFIVMPKDNNNQPKKRRRRISKKTDKLPTDKEILASLMKEAKEILKQEEEYAFEQSKNNFVDYSFEKYIPSIENFLGERMKCFALLGFTYDGKPVQILNTTSQMETTALDGLIYQLAAERAAISNIIIKNDVKNYFDPEGSYE